MKIISKILYWSSILIAIAVCAASWILYCWEAAVMVFIGECAVALMICLDAVRHGAEENEYADHHAEAAVRSMRKR